MERVRMEAVEQYPSSLAHGGSLWTGDYGSLRTE